MTIGEFAERAQLSPKALRIYDELGLVVPVEVDPLSGYRLYDESQLDRARLVALLRRLDMPLAAIGELVRLHDLQAAEMLSAWWDRVEGSVAERRALVGYLTARFKGEEQSVREVQVRSMPARKVLGISRHVTMPETDGFFRDAFDRLRALAPPLDGIAGAPFLVFYGEVSDDSDGPMELSRPVAASIADEVVPANSDIQIRTEPAHEEAYVRLSQSEMSWPAMLPFCDRLERWVHDHRRQAAGPLRQVLIADRRSAAPSTPVCDLSIPLR